VRDGEAAIGVDGMIEEKGRRREREREREREGIGECEEGREGKGDKGTQRKPEG